MFGKKEIKTNKFMLQRNFLEKKVKEVTGRVESFMLKDLIMINVVAYVLI